MTGSDRRSAIEKRVERSFEDPGARAGRPLSWRSRKTPRTVEAYLRAGVLPRYMERLNEIERGMAEHRRRLERVYAQLREECGEDRQAFSTRWVARARAWAFDDVNELVREHNEWYPVERNLPMDLRTRDYVRVGGRSYRRRELDAAWVLEHFPA